MTQINLLARYAASRDAEAFAGIVEQYQRLVTATCRRRLANPEDVDDAVQETFLRLARKASNLKSNLGGWLYACALNVSTDINRRRRSRARHESAAAGREESMTDAERELAELREHLDAAMERLSAAERELIIQRFFEGRGQTEIAAEAGVAGSTISYRLERAIKALREHLKAMGCGAAVVGAVVGLMEAEHASASVPSALTVNVMKIGLSGVAAAGSSWVTVMSILLLVLGLIGVGVWMVLGSAAPVGPSVALPGVQAVPASQPAPVAMTVGAVQGANVMAAPDWGTGNSANSNAVLAGRVTDAAGNGIAGAEILFGGGRNRKPIVTDAKGFYAIDTVQRPGEFMIGVKADGFVEVLPYGRGVTRVSLTAKSRVRRNFMLQRGLVLRITVVDAAGSPISNADFSVTLTSEFDQLSNLERYQTDHRGKGTATLPISSDSWTIAVSAEGLAAEHEVVTAQAAGTREFKFVLKPALVVVGNAICTDGKPATGWEISARPDWALNGSFGKDSKIDKDGNFTLSDVGPGSYALYLWINMSGEQVGDFTFPTTQPICVNVPYPSPSTWTKVQGRLQYVGKRPQWVNVDAFEQSNRRHFSALVSAQDQRNSNQYSFELPPGTYMFTADSKDMETVNIRDVKIPGPAPDFTVRPRKLPTLAGMVRDAASGQPIQHFAFRVRQTPIGGYGQDANWTQVSDPQGRFSVQLVQPGGYQVQISAQNYAWTWSAVVQAQSGTVDASMKLTRGGSVSGVVVDPGGKPVSGAKVIPLSMARSVFEFDNFETEAGAVTTDASGRFEIDHLAGGSETLKVAKPEFAPLIAHDVSVEEGKTADAGTMRLCIGGSVEGTVYDANGKPAPELTVQMRHDDEIGYTPAERAGNIATAVTDKDGRYRVDHLAADAVYATVMDRWTAVGVLRRMVRPMDGKTTQLDFGGTIPITGRVVIDGKPLANTEVQLTVRGWNRGPVMAKTTTAEDGSFKFFGVPTGTYQFFYASNTMFNRTAIRVMQIKDGPMDLGDVTNDPKFDDSPIRPFGGPPGTERLRIRVWNSDGTLAPGLIPKIFDGRGQAIPLGYFDGELSGFFLLPGHYSIRVEAGTTPAFVESVKIPVEAGDQNDPIDVVLTN